MIRIGQRLQEERIRKGLTVEEVSKAIKIRPSFIIAIEKGDYTKLPSSTYAQGFVRNYIRYLGLSEKETIAVFKREFDAEKTFRVLPEGFTRSKDFSGRKQHIHHTVFLFLGIVVIIVGYILFQYRYAFINPPLEVTSPPKNIVTNNIIVVAGKTDPNATLSVNNELVSLDSQGNFAKRIDIFPGETVLAIKATNKFGKETIVEKTVELK